MMGGDELRFANYSFVNVLVKDAPVVASLCKRKTFMVFDLAEAVKHQGLTFIAVITVLSHVIDEIDKTLQSFILRTEIIIIIIQ